MVNLTPNVYAHWKLNESFGNLVSDSSVNGRDGTRVNMEDGDWVAGKLNNCLVFDGTNELVNCGAIANFEWNTSFSYECWFKTNTFSDDALMAKMGSAWRGALLFIYNGSIYWSLHSTVATLARIHTNAVFNNSLWHHVIATYDGSGFATGCKIYVDNVLQPVTIDNNNLAGNTILTGEDFAIGARSDNTLNLPGYLDELVIYNKELSQEEVTFRWNGGTGTEDMVSPPPTAPSNPDPTDTATDINYNQNLDWDCPDADTYDIYLGTSSPPSIVETDHPTSDYVIPYNLDSCATYYWKIVAKNDAGETAGDIWSFTTNNQLPIIPNTPSPINNAEGQDLAIILSWECEDYNPNDTLVYDVYFGTSSPPPLRKSNHNSREYSISGLENDEVYYWKIVAKDDASCGEHNTESPIWNFRTKEEVVGGKESFDPRKAYRNRLASLWNVNKDCDELEKCIYITDSKGDRVYIPMYLSEEVKSEQLPALPFLELEIPPGGTTYEIQDIGASTRKMKSFVILHCYFSDTDNIDRTSFAKKIKDRLHDLTRYYQSSTAGITFMTIIDDGLEEETDGHRVIFHYILTLEALWYDICTS